MDRTIFLSALAFSLVACGGDPAGDPDGGLADVASPALPDVASLADASSTRSPDAPGLDAPGLDAWSSDAAPAPGVDAASDDSRPARPDPLQLAVTVHLESGGVPGTVFDAPWWDRFESLVTIFEAHGAVLSLEPRVDVLTGVGPARLTALRARGHEIGLHAAVGGTDYDAFVAQLRMRRDRLETAVGPIEHVSGNCGTFDWIGGVAEAGFEFTTAATVGCLLSIPVATRPDEFDALTCPRGAIDPVCHRAYPDTSEGTVHAWRAASGESWLTDDATGGVVVLPSRGTLDCIVEEMRGGMDGACTLEDDDISLALSELDEAVRVRDPSRPAQQYFVWSYGRALDPAALERFLSAVDERIARGEVEWATVNGAYHSFVAWEETHR